MHIMDLFKSGLVIKCIHVIMWNDFMDVMR